MVGADRQHHVGGLQEAEAAAMRARNRRWGREGSRARQVLPLEAREPGLDRCEQRVLVPWPPADFVYSCYGFAGLRLHSQPVAGIPSPVEQLLRKSLQL